MDDFKINDDMFGRYVRIQTDYSKALHIYKVVSLFASNTYCDIPILVSSKEDRHEQVVPVLNVIHCGIDESKVIRVALDDCEIVPTKDIETASDVVLVRHGQCPVCSGEVPIIQDYDNEYSVDVEGEEMSVWDGDKCVAIFHIHYCPNCGAKIDLEDEA